MANCELTLRILYGCDQNFSVPWLINGIEMSPQSYIIQLKTGLNLYLFCKY